MAGRLKLAGKIVRITSSTDEVHHLTAELGRIRWVGSGHQQHLQRKLQGVHQSGSIPVDQFRRGLTLVEALSDLGERAARELDLQLALGSVLFATKSYSHPDIGRAYARAWELCKQLGDHPREFTALRGLQLHHANLFEMEKSQHFAEEALRVAERLDDAARLVGGHMTFGVALFFQGKLEPSLAQLRRGFEMFDPTMQFPDWPGSTPGCNASSSRC